jgi:hypothetical protein
VKPAEALQATLAAEHAAVYVYAALGGRLSASEDPAAATRIRAAYDAHRGRRDQLRSVLADLGETPEPAAPAYRVDDGDRSPRHLLDVARTTETRCAAVYGQLVGSTTGAQRRWGIEALTDSSLRLLDLGGTASAFPGLPGL